jgi:hypothetical protein
MKKSIYAISTLLIIAAIQSCHKHVDGITKQVVIDTALASGQVYQLNLAQFGDADDVATIIKQGINYSTSSIANTAGTFAPLYSYSSSAAKVNVTDQVVLAITEGGRNGNRNCRNHSDSTVITLNFNIK